MINKNRPHVLVLPEDDANRQIADAFALEVQDPRQIQVLPEAGGWLSVCTKFQSDHVKGMRNIPERHLILLLDFDNQNDRMDHIMQKIPPDLAPRVFLLGVQSEPEDLKKVGLGSYEKIGRKLAAECRERKREMWNHDLLERNAGELDRLDQTVRSFLF